MHVVRIHIGYQSKTYQISTEWIRHRKRWFQGMHPQPAMLVSGAGNHVAGQVP